MQGTNLETDKRVLVISGATGISSQEVINIIVHFSEAAKKVAIILSELIVPVYEELLKIVEPIISTDRFEDEHKRIIHRLDFRRPRIRHQVLDRRPRNLIKKII